MWRQISKTPDDGAGAVSHHVITNIDEEKALPFNPHDPSTPVLAGGRVKMLSIPLSGLADAVKNWGFVILSAILTALVLYVARVSLAGTGNSAPVLNNLWIYDLFSVLFYVYAIGVIMPFFLFLLWRGGGKNSG